MSEITRYEIHSVGNKSVSDYGSWCRYDDITPIIQRNKDLETENAVQRLQIEHLEVEITTLNVRYGSIECPIECPIETKAAQIPDELVEWANKVVTPKDTASLGYNLHVPKLRQC